MASDQHKLMKKLGFKKYYLIGHDRGARVAHRMSLNYSNSVIKVSIFRYNTNK